MRIADIFDNRVVFADKLKSYIREKGYTRVSFAKKTEISLSTIVHILNGDLNDRGTFEKHVQKIFEVLKVNVDDIMYYSCSAKAIEDMHPANELPDCFISDKGKHQYELLQNILDMCTIYY